MTERHRLCGSEDTYRVPVVVKGYTVNRLRCRACDRRHHQQAHLEPCPCGSRSFDLARVGDRLGRRCMNCGRKSAPTLPTAPSRSYPLPPHKGKGTWYRAHAQVRQPMNPSKAARCARTLAVLGHLSSPAALGRHLGDTR